MESHPTNSTLAASSPRQAALGRWLLALVGGFLLVNVFLLVSMVFGAVASAAIYSFFAQNLLTTSIQTEQVSYETVKIYDRTGKHLLYESIDPRRRGDRQYLHVDQIPDLVKGATSRARRPQLQQYRHCPAWRVR